MDKKVEDLCRFLELIEKQAVVLHQKQENIEKLSRLNEITYETKIVLGNLKNGFSQKLEKLKLMYDQVKKRCEKQQLQMLYLLEKVEAVQGSMRQQGHLSSRLPHMVLQPAKVQDFSHGTAPESAVKQMTVSCFFKFCFLRVLTQFYV